MSPERKGTIPSGISETTGKISRVIEESQKNNIPPWVKELQSVTLPGNTKINELCWSFYSVGGNSSPAQEEFESQICEQKLKKDILGRSVLGAISGTLARLVETRTAIGPAEIYRGAANDLTIDDVREAKDGFLRRMGLFAIDVVITRKLFGYGADKKWSDTRKGRDFTVTPGDTVIDDLVENLRERLKEPHIQGVPLGFEIPEDAFPFLLGEGLIDEIDSFNDLDYWFREIAIRFLC
jgi:hypothetical protein